MWHHALPNPVLSPCIGICRLDACGYCIGCFRSGEEIAQWIGLSDAQRLHLMNDILPLRQLHQAAP